MLEFGHGICGDIYADGRDCLGLDAVRYSIALGDDLLFSNFPLLPLLPSASHRNGERDEHDTTRKILLLRQACARDILPLLPLIPPAPLDLPSGKDVPTQSTVRD